MDKSLHHFKLKGIRPRSPSCVSTKSQLTSAGGSIFNLELGTNDDDGLILHGNHLWEEVEKMKDKERYTHADVNLIDIMAADIGGDSQLDLAVFPTQIESLSLMCCGLDRINGCLMNLPVLSNLKRLCLNGNKLTSQSIEDSCFGDLLSLTDLQLSHNELVAIPNKITVLKSLQMLSLSHNKIETLGDNIMNLQCLEGLALNHNNLASLCRGILAMPKLHFFDISNNPKMKYKPSEIEFLKTRAFIYTDVKCGFHEAASDSIDSHDVQTSRRHPSRDTLFRRRAGSKDVSGRARAPGIRIDSASSKHRGVGQAEAKDRTLRRKVQASPSAGRVMKSSCSSMMPTPAESHSGRKKAKGAGNIMDLAMCDAPDESSSSSDEELVADKEIVEMLGSAIGEVVV